ncbi:MAG: single-stranded DNA-binding protein [Clostridiales bacterium]|nr:single-stranded DNA-binding protein [Candidatus Apopatousia equi]
MNKAILIGNLTKDPELTTTTSGVSVARFTLAISRRYTNSEGERETDFINVVAWRGLADTCHKFLRKGSKAAVVGTIQTRSYDAQDGSKRFSTEVVAEEVEFVGVRPQTGDGDAVEKTEKVEDATKLQPVDDDTLPF